jgi:hypothetical protein
MRERAIFFEAPPSGAEAIARAADLRRAPLLAARGVDVPTVQLVRPRRAPTGGRLGDRRPPARTNTGQGRAGVWASSSGWGKKALVTCTPTLGVSTLLFDRRAVTQ